MAQQKFYDPPTAKPGQSGSGADQSSSLPSMLRNMLAKESTTRDPTQPSSPLRQAIDVAQTTPSSGGGTSLPAYPRFAIKARIVGSSAPPMALLVVDDKVTMSIQPGRKYRVPQAGGSTYEIKVHDITSTSVDLELLPVNVLMTLH